MLFTRSVYLAMAGVSDQLFKTLKRRDHVPTIEKLGVGFGPLQDRFVGSIHPIEAAERNGYRAQDAIMLAIADHLSTYNSFGRGEAKLACEESVQDVFGAVFAAEEGWPAWLGFFDFVYDDPHLPTSEDGERSSLPIFSYHGSIADILENFEAVLKSSGVGGEPAEGRAMSLLNVAPIVRRAKAEAAKHGMTDRLVSVSKG